MMKPEEGLEAFADARRLIVVAAHPDDLETMCGGTIALLAEQGVEIYSVNCTLGDLGAQDDQRPRVAIASTRLEETAAAARILGLAGTYHLEHHDGELLPDLQLRAELARLYRLTRADTLLTFDPYWTGQIHPDHRAAGQAALDAYMPSKMPLYHPEHLNESGTSLGQIERVFVFATDRDPEVAVDVTDIYDQKLAASMAHCSQFPEGEKDLEWMKEIDRGRGELLGVPYAEMFKRVAVW